MQTKNELYIEKQGLQNGYLGFFKFCFFESKNFKKKSLLSKNDHKIQNFKKFKKNICCRAAVFNQCTKFQLDTIIFDPKRDVFVFPIVPNDDAIHSNAFFYSYCKLTGKVIVPFPFPFPLPFSITILFLRRFYFSNISFLKNIYIYF